MDNQEMGLSNKIFSSQNCIDVLSIDFYLYIFFSISDSSVTPLFLINSYHFQTLLFIRLSNKKKA